MWINNISGVYYGMIGSSALFSTWYIGKIFIPVNNIALVGNYSILSGAELLRVLGILGIIFNRHKHKDFRRAAE